MSKGAPSLPAVPASAYVNAVAQHVSSVCVITTAIGSQRFGLTATAVSSVSADPPRLLVCINKSGVTHDKIHQAGKFCVNVLTEEQDRIAMIFAGMAGDVVDRFDTGNWTTLKTGAPVLQGAVATFDCLLGESSDQASHSVLFGDVVATTNQTGVDTLLYGGRRFRQLRKMYSGGSVNDYL